MLTIHNLYKSFDHIYAIKGVDFQLKSGEIFGLIGPNGAGKTTILRILAGLISADSGTVELEGIDLLKNPKLLKKYMGFMPDFFGVYNNLKVKEYMEFYAAAYGLFGLKARSRCAELLEMVGLTQKNDIFITSLSQGMQQRLCLARVMIHRPIFLLLDEPATGLDFQNRDDFHSILRYLSEEGISVLMSSHNLTELSQICTHIGMMESGRLLVQGELEKVLKNINTSNPLFLIIYEGKEKAIQILKHHPLVQSLSIDHSRIKIRFSGDEKEEALLLRQLVQNHILVQAFFREQGNLETLFLQLTGQKKAGE